MYTPLPLDAKENPLKTKSSIVVEKTIIIIIIKGEGVQLECLTALKQRAMHVHAT